MRERVDRLIASICTECNRPSVPARDLCPACWSPTAPLEVAGEGTIESCTVARKAARADGSPPAVAMVAMDGGYRLFGQLVGDDTAVAPGARARVVTDPDGALPYRFELVEQR